MKGEGEAGEMDSDRERRDTERRKERERGRKREKDRERKRERGMEKKRERGQKTCLWTKLSMVTS